MITCGDFGGLTAEGEPCGIRAGTGTGRLGYGPCKKHLELAISLAIPAVTQPLKRSFLAAFSITGSVTRAALSARIDRTTHYKWLETDPEYAVAFQAATEIANDELEFEARRRAMYGVEEPVYQGGKKVGTVTRYSDTLMALLLKGSIAKYRDRSEITGKDGEPLIPTQFSTMTVTELVALRTRSLSATVAKE